MINQSYELTIQRLIKQELTVSELSDEVCREILRYLILKLRLKF